MSLLNESVLSEAAQSIVTKGCEFNQRMFGENEAPKPDVAEVILPFFTQIDSWEFHYQGHEGGYTCFLEGSLDEEDGCFIVSPDPEGSDPVRGHYLALYDNDENGEIVVFDSISRHRTHNKT